MASTDTIREAIDAVQQEAAGALARVAPDQVAALAEAILHARRVFVAGEGRSGLVARALAMRLLHLGREAYVAGETIAPAAAPHDLLLALSRSGATRVTAARMEAARACGAGVALVTSDASHAPGPGEVLVVVPAGPSQQFGGSLFEQAALLLLDALVLVLQGQLGQTPEQMAARHATLE